MIMMLKNRREFMRRMNKKIRRIVVAGAACVLAVNMAGAVAVTAYGQEDSSVAVADEASHDYINGFCSDCGGYEPAVLTTDKYDIDDDGIKDEVYEISNAGELYWFSGLVDNDSAVCDYNANSNPDGVKANPKANAVLTADITINEGDVSGCNGEALDDWRTWNPIGLSGGRYCYIGTFDGQDHVVSGIYCNRSSSDYLGLFGCLYAGAVIKNVGVVNSYQHGFDDVGGIVGFAGQAAIYNCYNTGTVIGMDDVGGIVGGSGKEIINCYNTGTVTCGSNNAGGIVGSSGGTVANCYNTGTINSKYDVGGIAGTVSNDTHKVINSYSLESCNGE